MMDISPLKRQDSFDPEAIRAICAAYENVCAALYQAHHSELFRENIAIKIIALAVAGERDPTRLYLRCLELYKMDLLSA